MSNSSSPSSLVVIAGLAALAAAGAGVFLFLRATPAPPPPVVATPPARTVPAPAPDAPPAPPVEPAGTEAVSGRVLRGAEGEEAVAGAAVAVYASDGGPVPFLVPLAKGESGADGRFRVAGVAKDRPYRVLVSKEGLAPATSAATGGGAAIDVRLLDSTFVAGTVKDAESKEPVAGARVVAGDAVGTTTGPDGAYRIEGVPVAKFQVTAMAAGYAAKSRFTRAAKVDLLLTPVSSVAGIVLDADGKPVAGADVTLQGFKDLPMVGRMATETRASKSGEDGKFVLDEVPLALALEVSARNGEGFAPAVAVEPLQKGKPAEGLVLHLAPGAILVVTVLDEAGSPVQGATVSHAPAGKDGDAGDDDGPAPQAIMWGSDGQHAGAGTTTDAAGVLRLRPVPTGRTVVTARKEDLRKAEETVEAPAAVETALTLRLAAGVAVTGKVADDLGNPVADAAITVMRFRGGEGVHETRKSGEDGTFRVGGLEGKGFNLTAAKEGFVQATLDKVDPAAGPIAIVLQRGGTLAGVAVDEEGKPVTAFSVTTKRTDVKEKPNPMGFSFDMGGGTEVKDEGGKFKVEGLAPGVYTVTVNSDGFAPGRVADVRVEAGATSDVKVVVPVGLSIRGIVVRKGEETPVEGAAVSVSKPGPFGGMDMDVDFDMGALGGEDEPEDAEAGAEARTAMTNMLGGVGPGAVTGADGRFVLKGLEAGTITLKVKAKEFAPATQKGVVVPSEAEVRILLSEGASIEGTVYDAQRAPRPGMMVMLQKLPMTMKMATTDARGHYRIGGLAPGKYLFYVMDKDAGPMGGGGMKSESVTLEEGKTLVKDHRSGEGVRLTGKVTRGGKPVGGVMVMLLPGAGRKDAASAMTGGSGFAMTSTKEDGSYEITGIAPGVYTAMVGMDGGGGPAPGDPVEIRPGATEMVRDIAMARNAVRGIVVDAAGEPVEGARVHAVASGMNTTRVADLGEALSSVGGQAMTGSDGKFAMEDMNPGSFTIQASSSASGTAIVENVVPSEQGTEVRVVLAKGVEMTVRVLDPEGKPVSGAGIYLSDPRGMDLTGMEMFDAVRTGEDGRVTVTAPPGTVHFEAVVRGHAPGTVAATAEAGAEVVITLPRGATIEVLVTDAAGSPRAGAAIRILDAAGNPYAARVTMEGIGEMMSSPATGSDGKYARADLPAGTWTVRAAVGERTADAAVTVAAGERKTVTVRLP